MAATPHPDDAPRRGRPTKLTPDIALGVAQCILDGMFRYTSGKRFGVSSTTFRRWMAMGRKFPDGIYGQFRTLVLDSEAEAERIIVKALLSLGKDGDSAALRFWLERKFPERWGRYRGELIELRREMAEIKRMVASEAGHQEIAG